MMKPRSAIPLSRRLGAQLAATFFLAILGLLPTPASAALITYQFAGTISGGSYGPNPVPFGGPRLVVTDTAVAAGNMAFQIGPGICPRSPPDCVFTGDTSGLVSFGHVLADFSGGNPPSGWGVLNINVTFNPDGTLGGSIFERGSNSDFDIGGDEFAWSGIFSADNSRCGPGLPNCTLSGYWFTEQALPIPEPGSIWLFCGGIFTLLLLKAMGLFRMTRLRVRMV